jgi:hypothetical protein
MDQFHFWQNSMEEETSEANVGRTFEKILLENQRVRSHVQDIAISVSLELQNDLGNFVAGEIEKMQKKIFAEKEVDKTQIQHKFDELSEKIVAHFEKMIQSVNQNSQIWMQQQEALHRERFALVQAQVGSLLGATRPGKSKRLKWQF